MSILDKIEERHEANLPKPTEVGTKVYYDVIFNDRVGNTAVHIETGGRGGSEEATIRLAELLAAEGFKVLVLTRDNFREPDVTHWRGVDYQRAVGQFGALQCHALVNLRHSPEPVGLEYEHYFAWVHDVPEEWCRHDHLPREDMHLVAVSQWQLERFQPGAVGPDGAVQPSVPWKSTSVIHPILPSYASYKHEPVKHRFLYASSVIKGLVPTLELWRSLSLPADAELLITNPGYDVDKVPTDLRPNEKLVGILPGMHEVAELMRTCEGLFYVNAWPENFSQTVAMADAIGLKTHVLCTSEWAGEGGLGETAPGNLITRYRDIFLSDFIRLLGKSITGHVRAKLGTVAEWVELLRLRESVLLNTIDTLDQANRPTAVAASAQEHLDATYTKDFYQDNLNRRHEFRRFAGAIALVFPGEHASVLDIGCGAGLVVAELRARGYDARGFDGSRHAVESADSELHGIVVQRSITDSSAPPLAPSDYTVCSEVAEHLPEKYAQDLIHLVARTTKRRCVWSAAPPGQHGLDHVNLQPPDYWLKPFAGRGLHVNESATQTLRGAMRESQSVHSAYAENFYVLERRDFANVGTIESISEPILGRPTSPDIFTRNDVPNWVDGTITVEHDRFRRRKNVVVVNRGPGSPILERPSDANWDWIEVCWHKDSPRLPADKIVFDGDRNLRKFRTAYKMREELLQYEIIALFDDDILPSDHSLSEVFDLFVETGAGVGHPALTRESHTFWPILYQQPGVRWRETNFVELQAPFFTRAAFQRYLPAFAAAKFGCGLEDVWREGEPFLAILDGTPVNHGRLVGSADAQTGVDYNCDQETVAFRKAVGVEHKTPETYVAHKFTSQVESVSEYKTFVTTTIAKLQTVQGGGDVLDQVLCSPFLKRVGTWCEFGVASGSSLHRLAAKRGEASLWGFDCFTGLPEDWAEIKRGHFAQETIPHVTGAKLVVGLFEETLPYWTPTSTITLAHIDCDIYAGAKCALDKIRPHLAAGSILVFDEIWNYVGFEEHEMKAFYESQLCGRWLHTAGGPATWGNTAAAFLIEKS